MKREIMAVSVLLICLCMSWASIGLARDLQFAADRLWEEERGGPSSPVLINNDARQGIAIKVTPDKPAYRPGEPITVTVVSDHDCYLTLMYLSPSGKVLIIWPYQSDSLERKVCANEAVRVPESGGRFKFVSDGSAPYERILAVACTEKNVLLRRQDVRPAAAKAAMFLDGTVEDFRTSILDRAKRLPDPVKWGAAEQRIRVSSSQSTPVISGSNSEIQENRPENIGRQTSQTGRDRKRTQEMWIGGYYVTNHRPCDQNSISQFKPDVLGFLNNKPAGFKTNFVHANADVIGSDFQAASSCYRSAHTRNGFDGLDSVHVAVVGTHGGIFDGLFNLWMGGRNGCTVVSKDMGLGLNNLRYLFLESCHSVEQPRLWFPAAKGIRAIFGFSGSFWVTGNFGRIFSRTLKSRHRSITQAFFDASRRADRRHTAVALWFGPDKRTAASMRDHEKQFHVEPVQSHGQAWAWSSGKPLRRPHRRKDISLIPALSVSFKPPEGSSEPTFLMEKLGLAPKGSLRLIDKESDENITTYYTKDDGPTLAVNQSSGAFDLTLPEFESKGRVEYGDDEAISIASNYCDKIESQLKSLPLQEKGLSAALEPCEVRHTFVASSSDSGEEPEEKLTQTCVVFRPVMNGLPTIGAGGVLEITLNSSKEVCRVRSVLREVASIMQGKSILDPDSLEPLAKQRALADVRQTTGDEDCKVKSVELGYFADDEAEVQRVSRLTFEVVVESGREPLNMFHKKFYELESLERDRNN